MDPILRRPDPALRPIMNLVLGRPSWVVFWSGCSGVSVCCGRLLLTRHTPERCRRGYDGYLWSYCRAELSRRWRFDRRKSQYVEAQMSDDALAEENRVKPFDDSRKDVVRRDAIGKGAPFLKPLPA